MIQPTTSVTTGMFLFFIFLSYILYLSRGGVGGEGRGKRGDKNYSITPFYLFLPQLYWTTTPITLSGTGVNSNVTSGSTIHPTISVTTGMFFVSFFCISIKRRIEGGRGGGGGGKGGGEEKEKRRRKLPIYTYSNHNDIIPPNPLFFQELEWVLPSPVVQRISLPPPSQPVSFFVSFLNHIFYLLQGIIWWDAHELSVQYYWSGLHRKMWAVRLVCFTQTLRLLYYYILLYFSIFFSGR